MEIHHDFDKIKMLAIYYAKEHNSNYTVILMNPDANGNFSLDSGSTYEFVADSYFEKERPNVKIMFSTKEEATEKNNGIEGLDKYFQKEDAEIFTFHARAEYDMHEVFLKPENNQHWKNQNKKGRGGKRKW